MPEFVERHHNILIGMQVADRNNLHSHFLIYDTIYDTGFFDITRGKVIILFIFSVDLNDAMGTVWTTIRKWSPQKERKYKKLINQDVKIVIEN